MEKNIDRKKIKLLDIKTKKISSDFFSGKYKSSFKGTGLDFSESREYRFGDDTRFIDWNVTARTGKTHIKVFDEERKLNIIIAVDVSASLDFSTQKFSKKELAAEIAAVIGYSAEHSNDKVGLILFSDTVEKFIKPNDMKNFPTQIIHSILSFIPKNSNTDISAAAELLSKIIKRRSIIFFISDFHDSGSFLKLKKLSARHDVICISLKDPFESSYLKAPASITFFDFEKRQQFIIDLNSSTTNENFISAFSDYYAGLEKKINESNLRIINISTAENYIIRLYKFFKK